MIPLTRLRHDEIFYLNPDLFERVDGHVDTVIRLTDGTEYVVVEAPDEIVRRIAEFRARIIAVAAMLQTGAFHQATAPSHTEHEAPSLRSADGGGSTSAVGDQMFRAPEATA